MIVFSRTCGAVAMYYMAIILYDKHGRFWLYFNMDFVKVVNHAATHGLGISFTFQDN